MTGRRFFCYPTDEAKLDIWAVLCAEAAAGVAGDEAQLIGRDSEHGGEIALLAYDARSA